MSENELAVSVQGLSKRYGDAAAVDSLSLDVAEGEVVGLLGPSGCGKTTTLRCLAGLEEPDGGRIDIGGTCVYSSFDKAFVEPERRGIGMVFQSYALWPHMSVRDNVAFPLRAKKGRASADEIEKKVSAVLKRVRLDGLEHRFPAELSGGQQQRVAVARAIVVEPKVLLFDEPLSNLDAKLRNSVRLELKDLFRELGSAAVYVTHDQQEAMALCDRIVVMNEGVIAQEGPPEEIYSRPVNKFVAEFVGEANLLRTVPEAGGAGEPSDGWWVLRPEDVELLKEPAANAIPCTVDQRLFLGQYIEYAVRINDSGAVAIAYSKSTFEVGAACYLSGPWSTLHRIPE